MSDKSVTPINSPFDNQFISDNAVITFLPPLTGHYFVELYILSRKETQEEIEDFNNAWKNYEKELEEWYEAKQELSDLGIRNAGSKPIEPERKLNEPEYIKCNLNISDLVITTWTSEWNVKKDHEVIVLEYYLRSNPGITGGYNIRITKKEWLNLITKLGAITNVNT